MKQRKVKKGFQGLLRIPKEEEEEQSGAGAGAELCQSQEKLGLAKPALPSKKLWSSSICQQLRSSSIYLKIELIFH